MVLSLWFLWIGLFTFGQTPFQESTGRTDETSLSEPPLSFSETFERLTSTADWKLVRETRLKFRTYHPQGLLKIGDRFLLSSVETFKGSNGDAAPGLRSRSGRGHLFLFDQDGEVIQGLSLGEGARFHPGGIDSDGRFVWIPVAEYRPDSASIIYRLDLADLQLQEVFRVDDHIGGLAVDAERDRLYGVSWGSRRIYSWDLGGQPISTKMNPSHYIDYQDCKSVGRGKAVCSGLNSFPGPDNRRFTLGGLDLVDLERGIPLVLIPVTLYSGRGIVMTQNPFDFELRKNSVTFYFVPEDEDSVLYQWDAPVRVPAAD
jgi:hypothetical protein